MFTVIFTQETTEELNLTLYKTYTVYEIDDMGLEQYKIKNDKGILKWYSMSRFTLPN